MTHPRYRDGISMVEFNKIVEGMGFQKKRERRSGLQICQKHNGEYYFSGISWRNPDDPEEFKVMKNIWNGSVRFRALERVCSFDKLVSVIQSFRSRWLATSPWSPHRYTLGRGQFYRRQFGLHSQHQPANELMEESRKRKAPEQDERLEDVLGGCHCVHGISKGPSATASVAYTTVTSPLVKRPKIGDCFAIPAEPDTPDEDVLLMLRVSQTIWRSDPLKSPPSPASPVDVAASRPVLANDLVFTAQNRLATTSASSSRSSSEDSWAMRPRLIENLAETRPPTTLPL
mmetsp:Transcript_11947/g.18727  ORF Transcript_11947/g.18727 Transcript_11947/m.18727 type:complete len:287 (+) Transcript_11947:229-1089(+)|eukprot:CAMPEP_0184298094 /NCGR_PEP_ID=MMETSP1049-20130417/8945_1 /TAXON_ID=77928 /ORGANISM="Proteomonas sulcata, Strain CCMP704" /LENGTH=286 /DNA_ID=CAMNT_0026608103 /DNA_START=215 /DNA_END=1075 /DNA_ORIENTATION=+